MSPEKLLERLAGGSLHNVDFSDFCRLAEAFGFRLERTRGSHHIYRHTNLPLRLNLQSRNGQAKAYQIRQLLGLIEEYSLSIERRGGRG